MPQYDSTGRLPSAFAVPNTTTTFRRIITRLISLCLKYLLKISFLLSIDTICAKANHLLPQTNFFTFLLFQTQGTSVL